jgi:hypothetical protein
MFRFTLNNEARTTKKHNKKKRDCSTHDAGEGGKKKWFRAMKFVLSVPHRRPNCVCQKIISTTSIAYPPPPHPPSLTKPCEFTFFLFHFLLGRVGAFLPLRKVDEKQRSSAQPFRFILMARWNMEKIVCTTRNNVGVYKFQCNYVSQNLLSWQSGSLV